jgi:hypothetical protein
MHVVCPDFARSCVVFWTNQIGLTREVNEDVQPSVKGTLLGIAL